MNSRRLALIWSRSRIVVNSRADPPRAAVGLVGDREVEARGPALVGGGDLGRGLVGGEHDPPPPAAQEGGDHARGRWSPAAPARRCAATNSSSPATRLVRADREVVERLRWRWRSTRAGSAPSSESEGTRTSVRLLSSRSAIHIAASVLPVPQAMSSWPRSVPLEALDRRPDRLLDVREGLLSGRAAGAQIIRRRGPRHRRKLKLRAEQVADRLALVIERPLGRRAEPVGGGDQQPVGEAGAARLG